jgi:hypothetical protein
VGTCDTLNAKLAIEELHELHKIGGVSGTHGGSRGECVVFMGKPAGLRPL